MIYSVFLSTELRNIKDLCGIIVRYNLDILFLTYPYQKL